MNRQIGVKNFIRVVILDPRTKGHVIQRMRNPKIAMVRYVQPRNRLTILQLSSKLQHWSTWNFRTIFGQRKCVRRCSIVTSQQIRDGGRPPFWRSLNHHISVKNSAILIKFGTLQQILNSMTVTWPKIEIFKMAKKSDFQDGGGRHLENRFFGHNSSTDYPISAKFCMRKQNGMSTRASWQKLQIFKIKRADGRHFENR